MPVTIKDPMYKGLLSVYTKRHIADSIAKYAQLYCEVNDSSIAKKDQELTAQMAASYNYNRFQKEALLNETIANRTRLVLFFVLSIVLFSSMILWNVYRRNKKQKEYELESLRIRYANATEEYNKHLQTMEFLEETHKKVIDIIQGELSNSLNRNDAYRQKLRDANTEYEESKAELVNQNLQLIDAIKKLEQREGIARYLENTEKLMSSPIVQRLRSLEKIPLSILSEKDWETLIAEFTSFMPSLLADLNGSPKMTKQKIRTCLLVALKIQDGCIANWLNLKPTRVSNIKAELNEELFGVSSARSLYNNLRQKYNIISSGK